MAKRVDLEFYFKQPARQSSEEQQALGHIMSCSPQSVLQSGYLVRQRTAINNDSASTRYMIWNTCSTKSAPKGLTVEAVKASKPGELTCLDF